MLASTHVHTHWKPRGKKLKTQRNQKLWRFEPPEINRWHYRGFLQFHFLCAPVRIPKVSFYWQKKRRKSECNWGKDEFWKHCRIWLWGCLCHGVFLPREYFSFHIWPHVCRLLVQAVVDRKNPGVGTYIPGCWQGTNNVIFSCQTCK